MKLGLLIIIINILASVTSFAQKEFTLKGTMHHTNLEGGCWYLETKRGQKYELVGSEENLRKVRVEERYVTLTVRQAKMMASVCMMGTIVEIIDVLDTNRYPHDPPVETKRIRGVVSKTNDGFWYIHGDDGHDYEMDRNTVLPNYSTGLRFNRQVQIIPGVEGALDMYGLIIRVYRPSSRIVPKYNDPR